MSHVFIPNSGVIHDIGGVWSDTGKIIQFDPIEHATNKGAHHNLSDDCCPALCVVDENGSEYFQNDEGCFIIPKVAAVSGLSISGITLSYNSDILTVNLVDSQGTVYSDNVTIVSTASGCCVSGISVELTGNDLNITILDTIGNSFTDTVTLPSGTISSVSTSECITGNGTPGSPITINLDPVGGIYCGVSGLTLIGSGNGIVISTEAGSCVSGALAPQDPASMPVNGTIQVEYFDDCINVWTYDGGWILDKTVSFETDSPVNITGCLEGDGTGVNPLSVKIDPQGGIYCGASGLTLVGSGNSIVISTELGSCVSGAASPQDPALMPVNGTVQLEYFDDCINVWSYDGGWILDKTISVNTDDCCISGISQTLNGSTLTTTITNNQGDVVQSSIMLPSGTISAVATSGCLFGDGLGVPVQIRVDNNTIICGDNGLEVSGIISSVLVSGCLSGDGTISNPISLSINPNGNIVCGSSGIELNGNIPCCVSGANLEFSGSQLTITLNKFDGSVIQENTTISTISSVFTSGCLIGDGTQGSPLNINLNNSSIICGVSGLEVVSEGGCCVSGVNVSIDSDILTVIITDSLGNQVSGNATIIHPSGLNDNCCISGVELSIVSSSGLNLSITNNGGEITVDTVSLPPISTSGCISGDGYANPITISINPSNFSCGDSGLELLSVGCCTSGLDLSFSGTNLIVNLVDNDQNTITNLVELPSILTSGCIFGDGYNTAIQLLVNPSGGLECTEDGIGIANVDGGTCLAISTESLNCIATSGNTTPETPTSLPVENTVQLEFLNDCIKIWVYDGADWQLDKELNIQLTGSGLGLTSISVGSCLTGDGDTNPIEITLDPNGYIHCGGNGLFVSGLSTTTSVTGCISGDGSIQTPLSVNLDQSGGIECGVNGLQVLTNGSFTMGQVGSVQEDSQIVNQPRFTIPDGWALQIIKAHATLGVPSTSGINIEFHSAPGIAAASGNTTLQDTLTIPADTAYINWSSLENLIFSGPTHLQERVNIADGVGRDLSIQIFYRMYS